MALASQAVNGDAKPKSRAQAKRLKKKAKRAASAAGSESDVGTTDTDGGDTEDEGMGVDRRIKEESVTPSLVDEIMQEVEADPENSSDPQMSMFKDVFAKFKAEIEEVKEEEDTAAAPTKGEIIYSDEDASSEGSENEGAEPVVSKRKLRKLNRLSVAELKRVVKHPEVVEWVDVTAQDPRLLICLKSHKNAIPIPQHWSAKRDYLNAKRGLEKPPFQLPSYIADTGIATQRDAVKEKEADQSLKAKTRERVAPKMGKIDIDYQKLHDAFFKYQTPPVMTNFGEMYYEGKEFETDLRSKRPGDLSKELIEALSIPPLAPPPWLIAMQRYGPPPSYPNLRIPGLNAPIPHNAQWGFHPGGWGKPPVDEFMRPLYGDVFGADVSQVESGYADEAGEPVVRERWGELEPDEEVSEDEEEEEEEENPEAQMQVDPAGLQTPSGLATPSGMASVASTMPGGLETPDFMELRKRREGTDSVDPSGKRDLYTVVQERRGDGKGFLGSDRTYDLAGMTAQAPPLLGQEDRSSKKKGKNDAVNVALDASELEGMTEAQLRQRYDDSKRAQTGNAGQATREDLSDVVASEGARRAKKAAASASKDKDKDKDRFKF